MSLKLYLRPNGVYYIRGTVQHQRVDQSAGTRSRSEAEAIRAKIEADLFKRAVYGERAVATFATAVADYIAAGGEAAHLDPLLDAFGTKKLSEITQAELDRHASTRQIAPATKVRQIYMPVTAILSLAAKNKLCEPPAFRKPKVKNARTEYLTPAQAEAWIEAVPAQLKGLLTFYLSTGCRATEAIGLEWKDVSPEKERVVFQDTKEDYARGADLGKRARATLPARGEGAVWRSTRGDPWHGYDAINLALRRIATRRPDLRPIHCHLLRHTWATWAYACTRDLTYLMSQGGWRDVTMVMRYVHAASDDTARAVLAQGWEFSGKELSGLKPKRRKPQ